MVERLAGRLPLKDIMRHTAQHNLGRGADLHIDARRRSALGGIPAAAIMAPVYAGFFTDSTLRRIYGHTAQVLYGVDGPERRRMGDRTANGLDSCICHSAERIILIYAMAVTSFGLAETFCRGFDCFPWRMIRTGDFDRVLLRPRSMLVQIAGSYFHIHRLSRVFGGICAIIWSLWRQGIETSPLDVLTLVSALAGGFLAYAGVFIMTSGIAFFTIKGLDWIYIFTNASYQVTRCPID